MSWGNAWGTRSWGGGAIVSTSSTAITLSANSIHETAHVVSATAPVYLTTNTIHETAHVVPALAPILITAGTIHKQVHLVAASIPGLTASAGTIHVTLRIGVVHAPVATVVGSAVEQPGFIPITDLPARTAPRPLSLVTSAFDANDYSTDTGAKTYVTAPASSIKFVRVHDDGAGNYNMRLGTINPTTGATTYNSVSPNISLPAPGLMPYLEALSSPVDTTCKVAIFYPVSGAWTRRFHNIPIDGSDLSTYESAVVETTSFTVQGGYAGSVHMGLKRLGSDGRDGNDDWYLFHPRGSGAGRVQRSDSFHFYGGVQTKALSTAVGSPTKDSPTHYAWITKDQQRGVVAWRDYDLPNEIVVSHFYREDDKLFPSPDAVVPYSIGDDNWSMASFNQSPALVAVPNSATSIKVKEVRFSTSDDDSVLTLGPETVLNLGWTASGTVIPSLSTLDDTNILIMAMGSVSAATPTTQRLSMWVANRASNGTISFSSRLDKDYITGATFGATLGQAHAHLQADKWALVSVAAPKANLLIVELQRN